MNEPEVLWEGEVCADKRHRVRCWDGHPKLGIIEVLPSNGNQWRVDISTGSDRVLAHLARSLAAANAELAELRGRVRGLEAALKDIDVVAEGSLLMAALRGEEEKP